MFGGLRFQANCIDLKLFTLCTQTMEMRDPSNFFTNCGIVFDIIQEKKLPNVHFKNHWSN